MNCLICDEKFNKTKHTLVSCLYCAFEACRECCKTYLVDQQQPKCMAANCGKTWTRRFLMDNFPNTFLQGDWKRSREKIAFDRETAQLPAAQAVLEKRNRIEKARNSLRAVCIQLRDLEKHYRKEYKKEKKVFNPLFNNIPADYAAVRLRKEQIEQHIHRLVWGVRGNQVVSQFVRACPAEECRGFLSAEWKCGLCKTETCSKCHVIKTPASSEAEHICNPDDVETAKLLAKDTKPCPKCHTGIFKIDGCDQMWCTQCHTAFSWKTGAIETHIHNPHYYEWQRKMNGGVAPRVPGDNPGGACPADGEFRLTHNLFRDFLRHSDPLVGTNLLPIIENIIRDTVHLRHYDLYTFQPNPLDDRHFLHTRIKYLEKTIDKAAFIRSVQKEAKRRELSQEVLQILQMFIQVVTDTLYRCYAALRPLKMGDEAGILRVAEILQEVEILRVYVNERLKEVFTTYQYKVREIAHMNDTVLHRPYQGVFITL